MLEKSNKVEIHVNGRVYGGWKSARIEIGMEQLARAFSLEVTDKYPGNEEYRRIVPGDAVQLFIGDDLLCTGYVTATPIKYDGHSVSVQVQGKSKTVDLVDCCPVGVYGGSGGGGEAKSTNKWEGVVVGNGVRQKAKVIPPATVKTMSWHGKKTSEIMAALAAPYGIKVYVTSELGDKVANHTVNPGEKVKDSINRLITLDDLVVTDTETGDLQIVDVSAAGECYDKLELGKNVLSASASFDASSLYSRYVVLGQKSGVDTDFGKGASESKGIVDSSFFKRNRLLVLKEKGQSTNVTSGKRATIEKEYRESKYKEITYTVQGWRQSNVEIWSVNQKVAVDDILMDSDEEFLIMKLVFTLNSSGMQTGITLIPPRGYTREGNHDKTSSSSTKKGNGEKNKWSAIVK